MRLLYITPVIPSPAYGRRPYNFLQFLAPRHKIKVQALTSSDDDADRKKILEDWGVEVEIIPHNKIKGGLNCILASVTRKPLRIHYCNSKKMKLAVKSTIEEFQPDLIHCDRMRMGQYALPYKNIPKVVDFTDSLVLFLERSKKYRNNPAARMIDAHERLTIPSYEKYLFEKIDLGLIISDLDRDYITKYIPDANLKVIPNNVDLEEFSPHSKPEPHLVDCVFVGTMSYYPNQDLFRFLWKEIWPYINKALPKMKLHMIGPRTPMNIMKINGKRGLNVIGPLRNVSNALYREDIFMCPLRIGSGVRNKILEAFACGMTVVSTSLGAEGIKVQNGVEIIIEDEPKKFAEAIIELSKNPERRKKIGTSARSFVEKNYSSKILEDLENTYMELIGK